MAPIRWHHVILPSLFLLGVLPASPMRIITDSTLPAGRGEALGSTLRGAILRPQLSLTAASSMIGESYAVGVMTFEVVSRLGEHMRTLLWYPADGAAIAESSSRYKYLDKVSSQMAYTDARRKHGAFPLVVISHGAGSSPEHHFLQAESFAQQGYVVAALTHAGDNLWNQTLKRAVSLNSFLRPKDMSAVIDALEAAAAAGEPSALARRAKAIDFSAGVVVVGHSMGGIAALALAGEGPSCADLEATFPTGGSCSSLPPDWLAPAGLLDRRVSAIIAMDPAPLRRLPLSPAAGVPALFFSGEQCVMSLTQWGFRNETEQYYEAWPPQHTHVLAVTKRSRHISFTNMCMLLGHGLLPEEMTQGAEFARWCRTGESAPHPNNLQVLSVVQELSLAFIDSALRKGPGRWRDIESGAALSAESSAFLARYRVQVALGQTSKA